MEKQQKNWRSLYNQAWSKRDSLKENGISLCECLNCDYLLLQVTHLSHNHYSPQNSSREREKGKGKSNWVNRTFSQSLSSVCCLLTSLQTSFGVSNGKFSVKFSLKLVLRGRKESWMCFESNYESIQFCTFS